MGGNLVLNFLMKRNHSVKMAIVTSPWLGLPEDPPKAQFLMGKIMQMIFPAFSNKTNLKVEHISRDPQEVVAYANDPLVHSYITPGFFFPIMEAGKWAIENASTLNIPTLLIHGTADQLTSFKSSKEFAENASSMVRFVPWKDGFHELHNDLEKADFLSEILKWIQLNLH